MNIKPLSDALGASITDIDLSVEMSSDSLQGLRDALDEHLLIVIRDQNLSAPQLLNAVRYFGDTMDQHLTDLLMSEYPEIAVLNSQKAPIDNSGRARPFGSRDWHTDHTNHARPPKYTALFALSLPASGGGDTSFANMQLAYEALPDSMKSTCGELKTLNKIENYGYVSDEDKQRFGEVQQHPLVRTHPISGRKGIYIHPGKTVGFQGLDPQQSEQFIASLMDQVIQPQFCYRHRWQTGDLLLCDNRALLHIAHRDYDPSEARVLHRVLVAGEIPQ